MLLTRAGKKTSLPRPPDVRFKFSSTFFYKTNDKEINRLFQILERDTVLNVCYLGLVKFLFLVWGRILVYFVIFSIYVTSLMVTENVKKKSVILKILILHINKDAIIVAYFNFNFFFGSYGTSLMGKFVLNLKGLRFRSLYLWQ